MKTVFTSKEIPRLWANQSLHHARNPQGNFRFWGSRLYSYSTCIARIVAPANDKSGGIVLHANRGWSSTTTRQQNSARSATHHYIRSFTVKNWTETDGIYVEENGKRKRVSVHKVNLDDYARRIERQAATVGRSRSSHDKTMLQLTRLIGEANDYAVVFKSKRRFAVPAPERLKNFVERARVAAAKRSAAAGAASDERKALEAKYRAAAPALLQAWLANRELTADEFNIMRKYECIGLDYVRLVGGNAEVETTRGARVAVAHIRRAIPSIDRVIASGQEWHANSHTTRLGGHELTYISADGIIHVGCHAFQRSEYERIRAIILDLPLATTQFKGTQP